MQPALLYFDARNLEQYADLQITTQRRAVHPL